MLALNMQSAESLFLFLVTATVAGVSSLAELRAGARAALDVMGRELGSVERLLWKRRVDAHCSWSLGPRRVRLASWTCCVMYSVEPLEARRVCSWDGRGFVGRSDLVERGLLRRLVVYSVGPSEVHEGPALGMAGVSCARDISRPGGVVVREGRFRGVLIRGLW